MAVEAGPKGTAPARKQAELPGYFYRLSARAQRAYLRSDAIDRFELIPGPTAFAMLAALMHALEGGAPVTVERAAQTLGNELCRLLGVPPVRIQIRGVRPRNSYSELHGIFYPHGMARRVAASARPTAAESAGAPLIMLWMRTAQRHDIVKPKTFVRTLMHELGHYLDYVLLRLGDSYHTSGFFKRESFLVRTLFQIPRAP